jgi:hypothetical protein
VDRQKDRYRERTNARTGHLTRVARRARTSCTRSRRHSAQHHGPRCRIEPYLDHAAPLRGAGGQRSASALGGPAGAAPRLSSPQISQAHPARSPVLPESPSSSPHDCPARGHRVKGGPAGRRFAQTLDPVPAPKDSAPIEEEWARVGVPTCRYSVPVSIHALAAGMPLADFRHACPSQMPEA